MAHFPILSTLNSQQLREGKSWLFLAIFSLALSGIAPLLLLAGRASFVSEMALVKNWFVPVLVIHVNLSVGLWFLALTLMLWRFLWPMTIPATWHKTSWISFLLSILCLISAPLFGGEAYTSNYIPVHDNAVFFTGLWLAFASLLSLSLPYFKAMVREPNLTLTQLIIGCNVLTLNAALSCFIFSILQHPQGFSGHPYFEAIFWGGGHVLQLLYVQLAMIAWLWMAERLALKLPAERFIKAAFSLLTMTALFSPVVYWFAEINSYAHIKFFTWQMAFITGVIPSALALYLLLQFRSIWRRDSKIIATALLTSTSLFLGGGIVSTFIDGSNTIIPAHYHGSTIGITLSLMGVAIMLLPLMGGKNLLHSKLAKFQLISYFGGAFLHMIGFAIAGSQGVGRKVAGAMDNATVLATFGMQLVRFGGILAVIGGAIFIILMIRSWNDRNSHLYIEHE